MKRSSEPKFRDTMNSSFIKQANFRWEFHTIHIRTSLAQKYASSILDLSWMRMGMTKGHWYNFLNNNLIFIINLYIYISRFSNKYNASAPQITIIKDNFTYECSIRAVFEIMGKFQSHGQNWAQPLCYVHLWQILISYMQYFQSIGPLGRCFL